MRKLLTIFMSVLLIGGSGIFLPADLCAEDYQEITVQPGDTLWSIANKYLKDPRRWSEIVKHNKISTSDPTVALPGTKLRVPVLLIKDEYRNAQLVLVVAEVRAKRRNKSEWMEAKQDMVLQYEDSIRTLESAEARIKFPSKEIVQINENSYIVIRPEKIIQEIQLIQGDLRASRAKVVMPHGTVIQPKEQKSDYQAKVRADNTEVVFVYRGRVDVTAQGKTVTVLEGFGTEVPKQAPPAAPVPLSSFPDYKPEMSKPLEGTDLPPAVVKSVPPAAAPTPLGKETPAARSKSVVSQDLLANYRVQISVEENFKTILLDRTKLTGETFEIKKQNIPDGTYFMRVAFIQKDGDLGEFSQPTVIVKDTLPPKISNLTPKDGFQVKGPDGYVDVGGTVEGATLIAVNEEVLFISPEGRFYKLVNLVEGKNEVKILARDLNGNEVHIIRSGTYSKN